MRINGSEAETGTVSILGHFDGQPCDTMEGLKLGPSISTWCSFSGIRSRVDISGGLGRICWSRHLWPIINFPVIISRSLLIMENEVEVKLEDFLKRLFAKMEIESSAHHHEILPFIRWVRFSTLFKGLVSECLASEWS